MLLSKIHYQRGHWKPCNFTENSSEQLEISEVKTFHCCEITKVPCIQNLPVEKAKYFLDVLRNIFADVLMSQMQRTDSSRMNSIPQAKNLEHWLTISLCIILTLRQKKTSNCVDKARMLPAIYRILNLRWQKTQIQTMLSIIISCSWNCSCA